MHLSRTSFWSVVALLWQIDVNETRDVGEEERERDLEESSFLELGRKSIIYWGYVLLYVGAKGDWDFRISDLVKNPDGTDI